MKTMIKQLMALLIPVCALQAASTNRQGIIREASAGTTPLSTAFAGYQIGDYAEGGVVIWLTADGQHGLVAAITDATDSDVTWGPTGTTTGATNNQSLPLVYSNATPALNYGGGQNQVILDDLIDSGESYPAAQRARDYTYTDPTSGITYTDWFLPASSELSCMYAMQDVINSVAAARGGTVLRTNNVYWSSREFDAERAWVLFFAGGRQDGFSKGGAGAVRCVRAF